MTALSHGKPLDLDRLNAEAVKLEIGAPCKGHWDKIVAAFDKEGVNPVDHPAFTKTDVLKVILPEVACKEYKDRSEQVRKVKPNFSGRSCIFLSHFL